MQKQSDSTKLRHLKVQLRNAEYAHQSLKEELIERRKWGQMMSNLCYNLSQFEAYDAAHRQTMKDCRENWDKIKTSVF